MDTVVFLGIRLFDKNKAGSLAESVCGMWKHIKTRIRSYQPYTTDVVVRG